MLGEGLAGASFDDVAVMALAFTSAISVVSVAALLVSILEFPVLVTSVAVGVELFTSVTGTVFA